jgi:hypothetical protein
MTTVEFELVAFSILAFIFGAGWGYYTAAAKWRTRYYRLLERLQ